MKPSYDAKQLGAELYRCAVCLGYFFMTTPRTVCLLCQAAERRTRGAVATTVDKGKVDPSRMEIVHD